MALVGFGLDSFIEVTAAGILLWRISLAEGDDRAEGRERVAHSIVGATFLALAAYIVSQASYALVTGSRPEESAVGLALAAVSTVVMPVLGLAKLRNATRLGSPSLVAESKETFACSYLSATLFLGLGANLVTGWWWADLAAALAMVPWIVHEGIEGLRGDSCEDG